MAHGTQIKTLQEQSMSMSVKLKNRKVAEAELGSWLGKPPWAAERQQRSAEGR